MLKVVPLYLHARNGVAYMVSTTGVETDAKWVPYFVHMADADVDQPLMTQGKLLQEAKEAKAAVPAVAATGSNPAVPAKVAVAAKAAVAAVPAQYAFVIDVDLAKAQGL